MLMWLIVKVVDVYTFLIVVYCLLTWIPNQRGWLADVTNALGILVNPFLDLFRKFIPPIGGTIDISPIAAIVVLQLIVRILAQFLSWLI